MNRLRSAAPRSPLAPLLGLLLGLAACQGSDPQPLALLSLDRFGGAGSLLDGGGGAATVGYGTDASVSSPAVRLLRHDPASPDQLAPLGDVAFGASGVVRRLRVTDEAAGVIVDDAVWVVDLTDPSLQAALLPAPAGGVDLAVSGRWVAVAVDHGLWLGHRDDPLAAALQPSASTPSALLATPSGFLAFTAGGYLAVDLSGGAPSFHEVADPALAGLLAASPGGASAMAAGPGGAFDRTRVVRLDLSTPAAPRVAASVEVAGAFVALAWDGEGRSVVAVHGDGDDASRPDAFHQGWLVREGAGGLSATGLPLAFWSLSRQPLAARSGLLLAAGASGVALTRLR